MVSLNFDDAEMGAIEFTNLPSSLSVQWWWMKGLLRHDGWGRIRASTDIEVEFWSRTTGDWLLVKAGLDGSGVFRLPAAPLEVLVRRVSTDLLDAAPTVEFAPVTFVSLAFQVLNKALGRLLEGDFKRLLSAAGRLFDRSAPITFVDQRDGAVAQSTMTGFNLAREDRKDPVQWPVVSVIIPTKDQPDLLKACLNGLRDQTDYPDLEVVLVDNGTTDQVALDLLDREAMKEGVTLLRSPGVFNFSKLCNQGVAASHGEVVMLLNNDVTPRSRNWLKVLVRECLGEDVGVVGPLLFYPDDTVQCASVAVGLTGGAGHPWRGIERQEAHRHPLAGVLRPVSALTGACLVLRRSVFDTVGGLDEEAFPVSLNDVDFCLRIGATGLDVLYAPSAEVIHAESKTRRSDHHPLERERRIREQTTFRSRWRSVIAQDPWYPPVLTRADESGRAL